MFGLQGFWSRVHSHLQLCIPRLELKGPKRVVVRNFGEKGAQSRGRKRIADMGTAPDSPEEVFQPIASSIPEHGLICIKN